MAAAPSKIVFVPEEGHGLRVLAVAAAALDVLACLGAHLSGPLLLLDGFLGAAELEASGLDVFDGR